MTRFVTIAFFLLVASRVSGSQCIDDDKTLTEALFTGQAPWAIFTCKVLTFALPPDYDMRSSSDGNIGATATAEIIEDFFGRAQTKVVTLRAGNRLTVGQSYLIFANGDGKVFSFGGMCDRWSKQLSDNAGISNEIQIIRKFAAIFKNKSSGRFRFTNSQSVVLAEGKFKKGKPITIWKHYYDSGIIKAEYDLKKNVTSQHSGNGFINTKSTVNKGVGFYEQYSDKVKGRLTFTYLEIQNDSGSIMTVTEYFDNGNRKNTHSQVNIHNDGGGGWSSRGKIGEYIDYYESGQLKLTGQFLNDRRIGLWKWYNEDGTLKTEFDYKDGTGNQ